MKYHRSGWSIAKYCVKNPRNHYEIRKTYIMYQDVSILQCILRIAKYECYGTPRNMDLTVNQWWLTVMIRILIAAHFDPITLIRSYTQFCTIKYFPLCFTNFFYIFEIIRFKISIQNTPSSTFSIVEIYFYLFFKKCKKKKIFFHNKINLIWNYALLKLKHKSEMWSIRRFKTCRKITSG